MSPNRYFLTLNGSVTSTIQDINNNKIRIRHGDPEVEISEESYNKYKDESSTHQLSICDKKLSARVLKYSIRVDTEAATEAETNNADIQNDRN